MVLNPLRPGAPPNVRSSRRPGVTLGVIAGTLGLGCCVYPVVLALLGVSSAAAAVDLGNRLYSEWGWAFKAAAVVFAATAFAVQRRRAKKLCATDGRVDSRTAVIWTVGVGLGTFGLLYLATKGLSTLA